MTEIVRVSKFGNMIGRGKLGVKKQILSGNMIVRTEGVLLLPLVIIGDIQ
jgi:hypothetical protein